MNVAGFPVQPTGKYDLLKRKNRNVIWFVLVGNPLKLTK